MDDVDSDFFLDDAALGFRDVFCFDTTFGCWMDAVFLSVSIPNPTVGVVDPPVAALPFVFFLLLLLVSKEFLRGFNDEVLKGF